MESDANKENKDKAYLAGMFSMIGAIFETDIEELMEFINMDRTITMLVLEKKESLLEVLCGQKPLKKHT